MSAKSFQTPTDIRIGIPNTIVTYFNSQLGQIGSPTIPTFLAALFSSEGNFGNSANVEHELAYDAILKNATWDLLANSTTVPTTITIALNGVSSPDLQLIIPAAPQSGEVTSGKTSIFVKRGQKISFRMSTVIGGILQVNHTAIEAFPA